MLLYILAVVAIIVGIGSFFKISDIQVNGNVIYSQQEIVDVAGVESGKNLILLNCSAVEHRILDNRNYVDTVSVERKLPGTVLITVRESKMLAYVELDGICYVMNRKGEILSTTDAAGAAGHIRIFGVVPLAPRVGEYLELGEAENAKKEYLVDAMSMLLEHELYSRVDYIDVSNLSALKFHFTNDITVDLGKNESLERKFKMLESILADLTENDRGTINLATVGEGHFIPE